MKASQNFYLTFYILSLILGGVYITFKHCDLIYFGDIDNYLQMAQGNYNVSVLQRNRIIVPFLAGAVANVIKLLYPNTEMLTFLRIGFVIVNICFFVLFGIVIFKICRAYKASIIASLAGLTIIFISKWTYYLCAVPLVDSLYLFVVALVLYGILGKSRTAILTAIFIGPFAKESFLFFVPVILYYGRETFPLRILIFSFLISGILFLWFRIYVNSNQTYGSFFNSSVNHSLEFISLVTFSQVFISIKEIFSLKGILIILSVWSGFIVIPMLGALQSLKMKLNIMKIDGLLIAYFCAILIQTLLTNDLGRMLFLASPIIAATSALTLDYSQYLLKPLGLSRI